jgi:hypothetical protein
MSGQVRGAEGSAGPSGGGTSPPHAAALALPALGGIRAQEPGRRQGGWVGVGGWVGGRNSTVDGELLLCICVMSVPATKGHMALPLQPSRFPYPCASSTPLSPPLPPPPSPCPCPSPPCPTHTAQGGASPTCFVEGSKRGGCCGPDHPQHHHQERHLDHRLVCSQVCGCGEGGSGWTSRYA